MKYEDIIKSFHTLVDDQSELSSSEELRLANRIEREIANRREWLNLKKTHEGITSGGSLSLPDDFKDFSKEYDQEVERAVYVGVSRYPVMPDQRSLRDSYETLALGENKIRTPNIGDNTKVELDYIATIPDRVITDKPFMNSDYAPVIAFGMALDFEIIEQSEAAFSKRRENQEKFDKYIDDMEVLDDNLREAGEVA